MRENVLARRYARALFEIANERGILDKVHEELTSFDATLATSSELATVIHSQEISKREKRSTIEGLLQDRASNVFLNFLLLLLEKNRERLVPTIAREFNALVDKLHKKIQAQTVTAVPIDSTTLSKLKELLDKTYDADVHIDSRIDPQILGGLIVEVDGQVFDGSLHSQLKRLRAQLSERTNSRMV